MATTTIGPQPPGTIWQIDIEDVGGESPWLRWTIPWTLNAVTTTVVDGTPSSSNVIPRTAARLTGDAATVRVKLIQPDTTVVDEDTVSVVLDMQQGQAWELQEYIRTHQPAASGGLTEEQAEDLTIVKGAVLADIGPGIGDLVQSIGQLITRPTLTIGSLSSPPYELEGDGEIPDIGDVLHSKFGIYWLATTIPPGIGHLHGNTEEYSNRLVQFRTLHVVGGVELVTEVFDVNWHGGLWTWSTAKPTAIEYSILPGVHLQVRWWQFP